MTNDTMIHDNATVDSIMTAIANGKGHALNRQGEIFAHNIQASDIVDKVRTNEKVPISLRMNKNSLSIIKDYAQKQGIPYQSFINSYIDDIAYKIAHAD